MRRSYPVCNMCEVEINPNKYEDCERSYIVEGKAICEDCFKEWLLEWFSINPADVAEALGVEVVELE